MKIWIYDSEVLSHDWLVVFQDAGTREVLACHNNGAFLRSFVNEKDVYIGFNSKNYDQFIMKAACAGADNAEIKALNDYLIAGGNGWQHPLIRSCEDVWFNNADIMDDMQKGLSLKAIEGHLGLSIEESGIPFDIGRPLTDAELHELTRYCKHDVEATLELVRLRKNYLLSKIQVGRMANLSEEKSLSMTNAKLTAAFLQARKPVRPWTDEREYRTPENLKREYIPQEVFDFFDKLRRPEIPSEDVFSEKLDIDLNKTPCTVGYGGIHAAITNYVFEGKRGRLLRNWDVSSYYPSLMIKNGYSSRNIPSFDLFKNVYERRIKAKKAGDKMTANSLKLVLNTTYGATLNQYNDLYDPLQARSVCISGQLYLLELACHLLREIGNLLIVELNTDGIMAEFDEGDTGRVNAIISEWQARTGFSLEEDKVERHYMKDVNNYIEVLGGGEVHKKGGYLVRGVAPAGAFNINNNAVIVAEAIENWFVNRVPPEETIGACGDVSKFQLIAKAGSKYREVYTLLDGVKQVVQNVNRVYAAKDRRYGKLYKVKADTGGEAMIESLPDHCLIDNSAVSDPRHTAVKQIDKQWYIDLAKKRIDDFYGRKPDKKHNPNQERMELIPMAATTKQEPLNVYQKLAAARARFLEEAIKKSGKNMTLRYTYFELSDIVPAATKIFEELGLVHIVTFTDDEAVMELYNTDKPSECVRFFAPMREVDPIVSSKGAEINNAMQRLGSAITYMRRYLYMTALDIVEADEIEARLASAPATKQESPKPPATPEERVTIRREIAAVNDNADEMQIGALKRACEKLSAAGHKDVATQIALKTDNFTFVSRKDCEEYIEILGEALQKLAEKGETQP